MLPRTYFSGVSLLVATMAAGCGSSGFFPDGSYDSGTSSGQERSFPIQNAETSGPCQSTQQCFGGTVCDPKTHACVNNLGCSTHADCGKAAYCANNKCVPAKTGTPCTTTDNCTTNETCTGGFCGCKGQNYTAENIPPNVLIVLDRSQSMNDPIGTVSKLDIATQAITDLVTKNAGKIRFGLAAFPGDAPDCGSSASCTPGAVFVDIGDNTATAITTFLNSHGTCPQMTPTLQTLQALASYAGLKDTTRPNYIVLVTDGQANCGTAPDPVPAVTALRNQKPEVKTFAIGFGSGVDPNQLNGIAQAGGTAIAGGPPYYYNATDPTSLSNAFATIAGHVLSCTYKLSDVPKDLKQLYVYEGTKPNLQAIPQDTTHKDGWDYDPATNQLTIYGASCQKLQSGTVSDLVIVYGCPLTVT